MSFFQNSRNFQVHNSQFNANPTIINNVTNVNNDSVATILWPHVAAGAIFDSAERHAAGKCHPGTRKKMIERIIYWASDANTSAFLLWLYGPAGAGKSALVHTICELLRQEHPETFAASFFFSSGHSDRGNALKLFTTLSYQLAIQFPSFRSQINDALSHDPSLPTKSIEIQFLSLIAQPLLHCQSLISRSLILIIDGLDECADDDAQREIIALLARLILQHNLPLRVLVASRPEYWIWDAFSTEPLPSIMQALCLRDDLDADKDMEAYLIDGFEKIRLENKRVMGSIVAPWPPIEDIQHFVYEASGQYVYASTILKFVGKSSRFCIPQKQLEIILSPGPHYALAFSELDRLYATILSAYPQWETMKRVLEGLLVRANTSMIKVILGVGPDELVVVLDALSSLIEIKIPNQPPDDILFLESIFGSLLAGQEQISFSHRSFHEFLEDETRSGAFHIDLDAVRNEIVKAFCNMIHNNMDQKYEVEPHILANIDHFTYHRVLPDITSPCLVNCTVTSTLLPHISRIAQSLVSFDLGCLSFDAVLWFKRDAERVREALVDFLVDREMYNEQIEFAAACHELYNIAYLAQIRAMDALSLCTIFKITPTIVYLADYCRQFNPFPIHDLFTIPGTTDVLSTITDHRHFLCMSYFGGGTWFLESMNLDSFRNHDIVKPSRFQSEWTQGSIFLAYHNIKRFLSWPRVMADNGYLSYFHVHAESYLTDSKNSDICDKEYFHNTDKISILALMTDRAAWSRSLSTPVSLSTRYFIVTVLCWFNRQLTNPKSLKLLQDYDESLQEKMITTMKLVFEQGFLPDFMKIDSKEFRLLVRAGLDEGSLKLIKLRPLPLPQGFREEQDDSGGGGYRSSNWDIFHNEVFGKPSNAKMKASDAPLIEPSCWHPHLAAHLLNLLVKCLYGPVDEPDIFTGSPALKLENPFRYFAHCLPYAESTVENLDALRAIVYLYPRLPPTGTWDLPKEFWPLAMEFVQKYDRSVLSAEELELFMLWLQSPDRADITTYVQH